MRTVLLFLLGLALACALITTTEDRELESIDLSRPATLLQIVTNRVREVQPLVRELMDAFTAPYRKRLDERTTLPADRR